MQMQTQTHTTQTTQTTQTILLATMFESEKVWAFFREHSRVKKDNQFDPPEDGPSFMIHGTREGYFVRYKISPNPAIKDFAKALVRLEIPLSLNEQVLILEQVITEFEDAAIGPAEHADAVAKAAAAAAEAVKAANIYTGI